MLARTRRRRPPSQLLNQLASRALFAILPSSVDASRLRRTRSLSCDDVWHLVSRPGEPIGGRVSSCAPPLKQPNAQSRIQLMGDENYYAAYLRRMGVLYFGILLIIVAGMFGAFHLSEARKIAYVKSHPSVSATITSKKETRGKSPYTEVNIDYSRETSRGSVHCLTSLNLPGWSSEYDIGKSIAVFPKEEACYDPYVVLPGDDSKILIVGMLVLALIGIVMIGFGSFSMRRF